VLPEEPDAPTAVPKPASRDGRAVAAAVALLLLVVAGLGFVLGNSGGSDEAAVAADHTASAGALELGFPESWRRVAEPPSIPGLELRDQLGLGKRGGRNPFQRARRGHHRRHRAGTAAGGVPRQPSGGAQAR
jgi:hypothetical protein